MLDTSEQKYRAKRVEKVKAVKLEIFAKNVGQVCSSITTIIN